MKKFLFLCFLSLWSLTLNANAQVWDFTHADALPEGGKLRTFAKILDGQGLVPTSFGLSDAAGWSMKSPKDFQIPTAFRFEADFSVGGLNLEGDAPKRSSVLWDSMYVTYITDPENRQYHQGFQVRLADCGNDIWQPFLYVGFQNCTECVSGPRVKLEEGKTVHLEFLYDANRSVEWDFNGEKLHQNVGKAGPIAPSKHTPTIGDRVGSNFDQFNGIVKRVAITPVERKPIGISFTGRSAFERGEKDVAGCVQIENFSKEAISDVTLKIVQKSEASGMKFKPFTQKFEDIPAEKSVELNYPIETRVKPGLYTLEVTLTGKKADGSETQAQQQIRFGVGPVFADRFPALIWMFNNRSFEEVLDFGFTHGSCSFGFGSPNKSDVAAQNAFTQLDGALLSGLKLVKHIGPTYPEGTKKEDFYRTDRTGNPRLDAKGNGGIEVSNPVLQELAQETARANAETFGLHPAFGGVLPNSELRDHTFPSFPREAEQYKAETGKEIPEEVQGKTAPLHIAPERFPDGVVPDDDSILNYYRWFWNGGDGWPKYNSLIADEYRKVAGRFRDGSEQQTKRPFFSFYDPAVRVPAKWGSGGNVDVLSQWIYAYPEPLTVAGPVEELFAMAKGREVAGLPQDVMIMTQIICYRAQLAPKQVKVLPTPQWVLEKPDADFPTIPPDSLQAAIWAMISKPVQGIMFHGYACIVETGAQKGYTYTNSETPKMMKKMLTEVVAPLGPTLKRLPREESPVAVLESFTSCIFAGHGTWGWNAPDLTFFQRSRLDPRVIYEETIMRDGFGNAKVLYAPQCDYLPAPVVEKIKEFQANGGILVGDELLCKALKADILVPLNKVARPTLDSTEEVEKMAKVWVNTKAQEFTRAAKEKSIADSLALREALAGKYTPRADSSSPELFTFARNWDGVDYLFVLNDHRTFGDYVGQWGMTMEKGLPFEGSASLADPNGEIRAVYELSRGGKVEFSRTADGKRVEVPLKYETNDGRMLLFLKSEIKSLDVQAPNLAEVKRGEKVRVKLTVLDDNGKPVHALLPVEIRLFDAQGKEIDGGGYACAENGICELEFQTNLNDPAGNYKIFCRDRASGLTCSK